MTDIKSSVLKDILGKKLNKAKEGITQILKDKSFKAIEDYKTTFKYELPSVVGAEPDVSTVTLADTEPPKPETSEADK